MKRILFLLVLPAVVLAEPIPPLKRLLPPVGVEVPSADMQALQAELTAVRGSLAGLEKHALLPDVEVYIDAVALAVENGEFYAAKDVGIATALLETARKRIAELKAGKASWTTQKGLVVRGYRSSIDGSAQPFGVEIRPDYDLKGKPGPMYVWLHGRGDKETNLYYLKHCETKKGQFAPPTGTITIFPFGRHCIGYKSAGEIDIIEATEAAQKMYPVDANRVALMGFSMGGAGAWHIGAHYANRWAVVHPGAGFVDVKRYTKVTEEKMPPVYESTLWGLYDVPDYARNFLNIPLVAYSGEVDGQKAAADIMEATLKAEGMTMQHFIGPKMGHKYHPDVLKQVQQVIDAALTKGRELNPTEIHFQTKTLRYNQFRWLQVDQLEAHWQDSRVDASLTGGSLQMMTKNVTALRIDPRLAPRSVVIDGTTIATAGPAFVKLGGKWQVAPPTSPPLVPTKSHGLQGPMDDVLLTPFLVVMPSKPCASPEVERWVQFESARFAKQWRELFRGKLRVKKDHEVTADDVKNYSLICWGDPTGNSVISKTQSTLPIHWDQAGKVILGGETFNASTTVPALIHPNPANPQRYLVINNGCSFREGHSTTNALQNPKLGDYALFDITKDPDAFTAGKVITSGFFDEQWRLKK